MKMDERSGLKVEEMKKNKRPVEVLFCHASLNSLLSITLTQHPHTLHTACPITANQLA